MKVYYSLDEFQKIQNPAVTTGTFDGVHFGHLAIIRHLREAASNVNGETVVLTFHPHPRLVLFPDQPLKLLNTADEKISLLEKAGVDHLIILPFTREFSMLSSMDFIRGVLVEKLGTRKLVIGYDHHFGRNREGSFGHLREFGPVYGFEVEEIPVHDVDNVEVSSTKIRKALELGDVTAAAHWLGYCYSLSGTVVKGKQLGRTIGFPTSNLEINDVSKLVPADGVYAVKVHNGGKIFDGMLNIGMRPTVGGLARTIETNILNFDKDIYGERMTLEFIERIRDEKKFESLDALKDQLANDRETAKRILQQQA